jgi:hypothetical protein
VACTVPVAGELLKQALRGNEHERQDDPLRLGEFEGPLKRRLRPAAVPELIADDRIEHVRLDGRRRPVKTWCGAFDHRGEDV